jgi:hypothetical protein
MTVLDVTRDGSGICSGRRVDVPPAMTDAFDPPNFSREVLNAVRTLPLMLALITSIQASTALRDWRVATSLAMLSFAHPMPPS